MDHNDENESISSGDESDTDDLTDSHQSDSEHDTKKGHLDSSSDAMPTVSQYGRYTRAFKSRYLHRPSWWQKSPFVVQQVSIFGIIEKLMITLALGEHCQTLQVAPTETSRRVI